MKLIRKKAIYFSTVIYIVVALVGHDFRDTPCPEPSGFVCKIEFLPTNFMAFFHCIMLQSTDVKASPSNVKSGEKITEEGETPKKRRGRPKSVTTSFDTSDKSKIVATTSQSYTCKYLLFICINIILSSEYTFS